MVAKKTAEEKDKAPILLTDPSEALAESFNTRTQEVLDKIDKLQTAHSKGFEALKNSVNDAKKSFSRIMIAVIGVLVVTVLTLLFALVAVVMTGWQTQSDTTRDRQTQDQLDSIQRAIEQKR